MKNPPSGVKIVMSAVCVMKDIKPDKINDPDKPGQKIIDYWGPSKKLLGDMSFLAMLKEYDKDNIPVSSYALIQLFIWKKFFSPTYRSRQAVPSTKCCAEFSYPIQVTCLSHPHDLLIPSTCRPLVKSVLQKNNFLISQPKHMLCVLKRTVSIRRFF